MIEKQINGQRRPFGNLGGPTYENKPAASGGTDLSLVTTGDKYDWDNKVDKVAGKGLSTNDYSDTEKGKVAANASAIEAMSDDVTKNTKLRDGITQYYKQLGPGAYTYSFDFSSYGSGNASRLIAITCSSDMPTPALVGGCLAIVGNGGVFLLTKTSGGSHLNFTTNGYNLIASSEGGYAYGVMYVIQVFSPNQLITPWS